MELVLRARHMRIDGGRSGGLGSRVRRALLLCLVNDRLVYFRDRLSVSKSDLTKERTISPQNPIEEGWIVTAAFHSLWTDWESGRGKEVVHASGPRFLFMD